MVGSVPATARLVKGLQLEVTGPSGENALTDMPAAMGGGSSAPTPAWLLRAAIAPCTACHTGGTEPSPVLTAMGVPREVGAGAVRLSLGRMTTPADLETLLERLIEVAPPGSRS